MPEPRSTVSPDARRVLIVVNPKAGARSGKAAVERLVEVLEADRFDVEVHGEIEAASARARELFDAQSLRTVVAAGGDGTVGLVVNNTPAGAPITVLPLGTENLLAKHLGMAHDPAEVQRVIRQGDMVRFDAGRANGRIFLLMASCGFDADVVRRLHSERHGHIHQLSYARPIFDSILNYQYPELRITCEPAISPDAAHLGTGASQTVQVEAVQVEAAAVESANGHSVEPILARWAFVMNLPRYAAGLQIVPQALGDDGLLDVCTFKEGSLWSGLTYLAGVLMGQHQTYSDCVNRRAARVRIESDEPAPYQLDGDPGGFTPLEIDVVPSRLTMLAPRAWAEQHAGRPCEAGPS